MTDETGEIGKMEYNERKDMSRKRGQVPRRTVQLTDK
jgi:hypothetical protein